MSQSSPRDQEAGAIRPRLFIIHHGLVDLHSHYYGEARAWVASCRSHAIAHRLYVGRNALPAIVQEFAARPEFPHAPDAILETDATCRALADFLTLGANFAAACAALEQDGVSGDDIVVVTFATERDLFGAAQWLARLAPAARPSIAFIFHLPRLDWATDEYGAFIGGEVMFHRYAIKRLLAVLPLRQMALFAANPRLARALTMIFGVPCADCPIATLHADEAALAALPSAQTPHVHVRVAGEFRLEKGSDIVADVIARFGASRPGRSFGVQLGTRSEAEALAARLAGLPVPVHIHYGPLGQDEFMLQLARSDIVLLPYRWQRYAMRASGIFAEALGLGRVVVVPAQTAMGEQLAAGHGAGVTFRGFSAASVAEALVAASDRLPELSQAALSCRRGWRASQSADALLDQVLRRFGRA